MAEINGRPTIDDVAREAGVSQTTVSYVLSGSRHADRISAGTKKRIFAAAELLGYSRNSVGAALQRGYSDTVVLLAVTWDLATAHSQTTVSISRAAAKKGLEIIVHVADGDEHAAHFLREVPSLHPYGLLLLWDSSATPEEELITLAARGIPIIDLMPPGSAGIVSVTSDREQGMYLSTKHLTDLGHRRIGIVLDTASRWRTSNQKLIGYKRGLLSAGIEFDEGLLEEASNFDFEAGYEGLKRLIGRSPDVTAVMCLNDPVALGVVAAAKEMGLDVPEDLSVVGYGAHKEGRYFHPKLTTVAAPAAKIADAAMEIMMNLRNGGEPTSGPVYEPMELIVRESTGPAKESYER